MAEAHGIDAIDEREPDLGFEAAKTWVQDQKNQQALLDCFRTYVKPERLLCFF